MAEENGEQPKQYLVAHVREALAREPELRELNVDVAVAGGKVFLRGTVATESRRRRLSRVVSELLPGYEILNETDVAELPEAEEVEELR